MSKEKKNRMRPLWMPLYVEKFLADTREPHSTEGGAYINLLCAMWRSDDGTLPNHNTSWRAARVGREHWSRIWRAIQHCSILTATGLPTPTFKQSLERRTR